MSTPSKRTVYKAGKHTITAAGVVFYTRSGDKMHLLLQDYKDSNLGFQDFGGCMEPDDINPFMTALRETVEECNASIFNDKCTTKDEYLAKRDNEILMFESYVKQTRFKGYIRSYVISDLKYMLFLVHLDGKFSKKLTPQKFGDYEFHEGHKRTVQWVCADDIILGNCKLHPRLYSLPEILYYNFIKKI